MDARAPRESRSIRRRRARLIEAPERLPYHERRRGRNARSPLDIGWRGWVDIVARVVERIGIDNIGLITAGVTFYIFLALIPAMIAVATVYGLTIDSLTLNDHVTFLRGYLPDQAITWISEEIGRVGMIHEEGMSLAFFISLGISFWSMNNAVIALFGAMNIAYGEVEKRNTFVLYFQAFAFTTAALVAGLLMVGAIVLVPLLFSADGFAGGLDYGGRRVTAPFLFLVVAVGSAAIFRLGPSRRAAKWRWIATGALLVAAFWLAASTLLSWYLSNVADYSRLYGSLGTIIALMFWFFISVYILVLGAQLNAEVEHQTVVDTTIGPDQPMGRRGAYVADTVGKENTLFT